METPWIVGLAVVVGLVLVVILAFLIFPPDDPLRQFRPDKPLSESCNTNPNPAPPGPPPVSQRAPERREPKPTPAPPPKKTVEHTPTADSRLWSVPSPDPSIVGLCRYRRTTGEQCPVCEACE